MNKEQLQKSKEQLTRIAITKGHESKMYKAYAEALISCQNLYLHLHGKKAQVRHG